MKWTNKANVVGHETGATSWGALGLMGAVFLGVSGCSGDGADLRSGSYELVSITLEAESHADQRGTYLEPTQDAGAGQNVGWIDNGDWLAYDISVGQGATYEVSYRVASQSTGGRIVLQSKGGGTTYGSIDVPVTGAWQAWTTITHRVSLPAGPQGLRILAERGGFNINWFEISTIEPTPLCGNAVIEQGEQCDDGNHQAGDGCAANCTVEGGLGPFCGNAVIEGSEDCDDGNNHDGDGCSSTCVLENGFTVICGNAVIEAGEQCDDGNNQAGDGCASDCVVESVCGDGIIAGSEECDDGSSNGHSGCASDCTLDEISETGQGEIEAEDFLSSSPLSPFELRTEGGTTFLEFPGSGDGLFVPSDGASGQAHYSIRATESSAEFFATVHLPSYTDDSFFYKLEGVTGWLTHNNTPTSGFTELFIARFSGLSPGQNYTLKILRREDGAKIDSLRLSGATF